MSKRPSTERFKSNDHDRRFEFVPPNQRRNLLWKDSTNDRSDHDLLEATETPSKKVRLIRSNDNASSDSESMEFSVDIDSNIKWKELRHNGPLLPTCYESLPSNIYFLYNGKPIVLSEAAEEVATLYAKVLKSDISQKSVFKRNFFKDFRKSMSDFERKLITKFELCDFGKIADYFHRLSETKKKPTPEIQYLFKMDRDREIAKYAFCVVDGMKEKIANYRVEPPGLFRGRGDHPKMGKVKKRIQTEDAIINCSANGNLGSLDRRWKDVIHDPYVSWLASWDDSVLNVPKYIKLSPASRMRRVNDIEKFEVARCLGEHIDKIRSGYRKDWLSSDMFVRQRGVAVCLIDKLALRVGYEKIGDQPDTVGCCTLRVEHITLDPSQPKISLKFRAKDSIWYERSEIVENEAFENLKRFVQNKSGKDLLFDRLTAPRLTSYLKSLMPNLTPKVFRTYHASVTLQNQLDLLTVNCNTLKEKLNAYNEANREVAVLCNHQRSPPKNSIKSLSLLTKKINSMNEQLNMRNLRGSFLSRRSTVASLQKQVTQLEFKKSNLEKNCLIALGTSKLNYMDPRISVAWCITNNVPITKVFNSAMLEKFSWAIDQTHPSFRF